MRAGLMSVSAVCLVLLAGLRAPGFEHMANGEQSPPLGAGLSQQPRNEARVPVMNRVFYVEGFQASAGKTQFDAAKDDALEWIRANNAPAVLQLGNGIYPSCTGVQMPTSPIKALTIVGIGKGEMGKGTTIKASCPMGAVINFPALPKGNWWSDVRIAHLSVDANDLAQSCMDLEALRVSRIEDISCMNAIGPDHWVQIGDPNPPKGLQTTGFQVMVNDLFVFNNATESTQWTEVQPILQGDSISDYKIVNGGAFRQKSKAPVILIGYGAGAKPCKIMPSGVEAHLTLDPRSNLSKVASITQAAAGHGCTGPIYAHVLDLPAAKYGIQLAVTDSTFTDLTVDSVGTNASIANMLGGANTFVHAHAWQSPVLFQTAGNDVWVAPECDNPVHYCFDFEGRDSQVTNAIFYWFKSHDPSLSGAGGYYFGPAASGIEIAFEDCGLNLQDSGGYQRFVTSSGPLPLGSPGFGKRLTVLGGHDCASPLPLPPGVSLDSPRVESTLDGTVVDGGFHNVTVATHDGTTVGTFLLVKLSAYAFASQTADAIGIRFMGGRSDDRRFSGEFRFVNGPKGLSYDWMAWGNPSGQQHAGISAYSESDGSVNVYLFVGPDRGIGSASVEFKQGTNMTIFANPLPVVPVGRKTFSSDDPRAYPETNVGRP